MTRLRVLLVTNDDRGGAAVLVSRVARYLDPDRFAVSLFLPRAGFLSELVHGRAEVILDPDFAQNPPRHGAGISRIAHTIQSRAQVLARWWRAGQHLRRLVRERSFAVVSAFSPEPQVFCALAGLGMGVPVVANPLQSFDEAINLRISQLSAALPSVRAVLAVSRAVAEEYRALGPKVQVAYNGVDPDEFDPRAVTPALRQRFGVAPHTPIFAFVGRPTREKGIDLFLEAAARVHAQRPEARFALLGVGVSAKYLGAHEYPFRHELPAVLGRLGLGGVVLSTGPVDDLRPYLADVDAVVLPSRRDAAPLVGFEAMSMARPVVGFAVQGIPELVRDQEEGLLAPPEEVEALAGRMIALIDDPNRAKILGQQGRKRVIEHFDLRRNVAKMGEIYQHLAHTAPEAPAPRRGRGA